MQRKGKKSTKRGWSDTKKGAGTFAKRNGLKRQEENPEPIYDPDEEWDSIDQALIDHVMEDYE